MSLHPKEQVLFQADALMLKITSLKSTVKNVMNGKCRLIKSGFKTYTWSIMTAKEKVIRNFNFHVDRQFHARVSKRENQFTIVVNVNNTNTQLIGKLNNVNENDELIKIFNNLQKITYADNVLTVKKENIGNMNKASPETVRNHSSAKFDTSSPFQNKNLNRSENSQITKTPKRTPLREKARIFPRFRFQTTPVKIKSIDDDDDDDFKITAYGARKTQHFYSDKKSPKFTVMKSKVSMTSDIFQQRNDAMKIQSKQNDYTNNENSDKTAVVGFSNLGNTCYMNSILQCLLNIPNFFQNLINELNVNLVQHESLYNCICNLGVLKHSYDSLQNQRFALKRVKKAISSAAIRFSGFAQHDAHEFLCQCFDQLKDDLAIPLKELYSGMNVEEPASDSEDYLKYACPIRENFESVITHSIKCNTCNENVDKNEVCQDFSLVIPDKDENSDPADPSIVDLLKCYFMEEVVEYTCEKCKATSSVLSHQFKKLPRVLIIHLKRYDMFDTKRNDRVLLPKIISLQLHASKNVIMPRKFIFDKSKFKMKSVKDFTTESKRKHSEDSDGPGKKYSKSNLNKRFLNMEGELLAQACRDSKRDDELLKKERNYTKLQSSVTSSPCISTTSNDLTSTTDDLLAKDLDDFDDEELKDISKLTTVSEDEEDEFQKALEMSLRDAEENVFAASLVNSCLAETSFSTAIATKQASSKIDSVLTTKLNSSVLNNLNERDNLPSLDSVSSPKPIDNSDVKERLRDLDVREDVDVNNNKLDSEYHLVGIVNHHGANTATGHYTSDSFDFKSKKWRNYNDSTVKEIKEHEVRYGRTESAYIVFYMHKKCYENILNTCCQI